MADNTIINWTAPDDQGSEILTYTIYVQKGDLTWSTVPAYCDGSLPAIRDAYTCTIPSLHLHEDYDIPWGTDVQAKVMATNSKGDSPVSEQGGGGVMIYVPEAPINLVEVLSLRTSTTLGFSWEPGLDDGSRPLIDYTVYVTDNASTYDVTAPTLETTQYTAFALSLGTIYHFTVTSRNDYGTSAVSDTFSLLAAIKPNTPTDVTSTNVGSDALVCWTEPYDNGSPITAYKIYLKTVTNTYEEELTYCDGSNSVIVSATCCTIPLTVFKAAPYSLYEGDHIYAKVSAINYYGESVTSQVGDGASLIVVPDAPVDLQNNPAITDSTRIGVTWFPGSSTGGTPIIDYEISYAEEASSEFTVLDSAVALNEYTTTIPLVEGQNYKFKVRARNSVGYSEYSAEVVIRVATEPEVPTNVDTSVVDGYSVITWT